MILKVISKYGLAAHLGLLAALPSAYLFLGAAQLGVALLWVSLVVGIWVLFCPSILIGERSANARARVVYSIVRDPAFYFMLLLVGVALVRWLNSGIAMVYDPEHGVWVVKDAVASFLPASTSGAGFLPMALSVALLVVVTGVRHSLGLSARMFCGLTTVFVVGLLGLSMAIVACLGVFPELGVLSSCGMIDTPFAGASFGMFLVLAIVTGAAAECRKWSHARGPYVLAVAGTASGLVFFAPSVVAAVYLLVALIFALFSFAYCARAGSMGGFARMLVLTILGFSFPVLIMMALAPAELQQVKVEGLDLNVAFPVEYDTLRETISRISKTMWLEHPWCGTGLGAFGLHVPFIAVKADWAVLPPHVSNAISGYWTILAERGIIGCALLVVGVGIFFWSWCTRLVSAFMYLRGNDEADIFVFACPPIVWIVPAVIALAVAELHFSNALSSPDFIFAFTVPFVLSAASFPRKAPPVVLPEESGQDGEV